MVCGKSCGNSRGSGAEPVYLNVYDLTPINGYAYWFGLGVYHSGVQGFDLRILNLQRTIFRSAKI